MACPQEVCFLNFDDSHCRFSRGGDSATVGLLLEELKNPPDPFHQGKQELGFSSERFAPLEELPAEEAEEEEAIELGAAQPAFG